MEYVMLGAVALFFLASLCCVTYGLIKLCLMFTHIRIIVIGLLTCYIVGYLLVSIDKWMLKTKKNTKED